MIIKCKMCGGDLIQVDATVCECDSCGTRQTIPNAGDDKKINLFNRANRLRMNCEFDKAAAIYEQIVAEYPEEGEAFWGLCLCNYGIEYVDDPATGAKMPTCHRTLPTSIMEDSNFEQACDYADTIARKVYRDEAKAIDRIQKDILSIAANEAPYDVFICYKETTEDGSRTEDSVLAQDIYDALTAKGMKVFFSRITLEDKLGVQYEPYIYAALSSAKVMLAIGTAFEYYDAVWVKNEWSRFLGMMKTDKTKSLIPCYKGLDAYDMPKEFKGLQAQDMGKLGWIQDLVRGVEKLCGKVTVNQTVVREVVQNSSSVSSLMERAYLFMEDGDFKSATEYLNRVLDIDPKYAPAYAAKVAVSFRIRKEAGLADTTFLYEDDANWQKAIRFATAQQKATYEGYLAKVKERVAVQMRNYAYDCAVEMAVNPKADRKRLDGELESYKTSCTRSNGTPADGSRRKNSPQNENTFKEAVRTNEPGDVSEQGFKTAAAMFEALQDDAASECAKQCRVLAEQARQKWIYNNAADNHVRSRNFPAGLEQAAEAFLTVPQYKDAKAQAQKCMDEAEAIRDRIYTRAVKLMKEAGDSSGKWKTAKNELDNAELNNYRDAEQLRAQAAKRYTECAAAEKEADRQREEKSRREEAAAAARKKRNTILGVLTVIIVIAAYFAATQFIIPEMKYKDAEQLRARGSYEEAAVAFAELVGYKDSVDQICVTYYEQGVYLRNAGNWAGAVTAFTNAGSYSDAATQISKTYYAEGEAKRTAGDWNGAVTAFTKAGVYSDATTQIGKTFYLEGEAKRTAGDWDGAVAAFKSANARNYSDAATQMSETYYMEGEAMRAAGNWAGAVTAFKNAGNYGDAATQIKETYYQQAQALMIKQDYTGAYVIFSTIKGYKDVDNLLKNDKNFAAAAALEAKFTVGKYVTYGHYPQTKAGNDNTPIEWLVLARDGNKALLISRYALDCQPYNNSKVDTTWQQCNLRAWLNGRFINKAFTSSELKGIVTTNVDNSKSQGYSGYNTNGGNNTQDKVFLLSYVEAWKYFKDDNARMCVPTEYAVEQRANTNNKYKVDGKATCYWWLRSPGYYQDNATVVSYVGSRDNFSVSYRLDAVRPALWVNLESGIF